MTYSEMLAPFDARVAESDGCHLDIRTRRLPAFTPGDVDAIITAVDRRTSSHSMVLWHHFHGADTRIPADAMAFSLRREHFMLEIVAGWEHDGSNGAEHRQWAQDLWESLAPVALPGGYANQLWGDVIAKRPETPTAATGARLRRLKHRFDPDGVFASAIPLPDEH